MFSRKVALVVSLPLIGVLICPPLLYAYPDSQLRQRATDGGSRTGQELALELHALGATPFSPIPPYATKDGGTKAEEPSFTVSALNSLLRETLGVRHDVKFEPRPETHPIQFIWKGGGQSSQLVRIHASVDLMDDPLGVLDKILDEAKSPRNRPYLTQGRISASFENLNERIVALERENLPAESPDAETASDGGEKDAELWTALQQLKREMLPHGIEIIFNERPAEQNWPGVTFVWEDKAYRVLESLPEVFMITYPPGTSAEEIIRAVSNATEASLNYSKERKIALSAEVKAPFVALAEENGISAAADGGAKVAAPTLNELKTLLRQTLDPTRTHHHPLQFTKQAVTAEHPVHFVWRGEGKTSYLYQIQVWDQWTDPIAILDAILNEWKHPRHEAYRTSEYVKAFKSLDAALREWKLQSETPGAFAIAPFTRPEIAALLKSFKPVNDAHTPFGQIAPDLEKMTKPGALLISESLLEDASLAERLKNWPKNVPIILLSRSGKWQEILEAMYAVSQGEQSLPRSTFFAIITPTALFVNGKSVTLPINFSINRARDVIELIELETENQIVAYAVEEELREGYQAFLGKKAYGIIYDLPKEGSKQVSVGVGAFNQLLEYLALPQRDREELMKLGVIEVITPAEVQGRIGDYLRAYTETLRKV